MIDRLRAALRQLDGFLRRTQAGVAAYRAASPERLDELDRAVLLQAMLGPVASLLAENSVLRGAVSAILLRGGRPDTLGCRVCHQETGHAVGCEVGIAQAALEASEVERAKRGDTEGKA